MSVLVYTTRSLFTNEGDFLTLNQANGTLYYPDVQDDYLDAYADIALDLSPFPDPEEIGQVYNVIVTPSYNVTSSPDVRLGSYPSNPPRRYYGNMSYCQGEYINSISYLNYEKGYVSPFFYRYSPKIVRPSFTDAPVPTVPLEIQSFAAGIIWGMAGDAARTPPYDGYRYADSVRTYKNADITLDVVLNYSVDLICYADLTVVSSWGYYSV